jgi:hypothetical protein
VPASVGGLGDGECRATDRLTVSWVVAGSSPSPRPPPAGIPSSAPAHRTTRIHRRQRMLLAAPTTRVNGTLTGRPAPDAPLAGDAGARSEPRRAKSPAAPQAEEPAQGLTCPLNT